MKEGSSSNEKFPKNVTVISLGLLFYAEAKNF